MIAQQRSAGRFVEYAAAAWAGIFSALHVAWAAGWYVGLPATEAEVAFARGWFWTYNLIVAGACLLGFLVALAFVEPWGRRLPRPLLRGVAWIGTCVLVARAIGSLLQLTYRLLKGRYAWAPMQLYELWFYLGAVLFAAALWRFVRVRPNPGV